MVAPLLLSAAVLLAGAGCSGSSNAPAAIGSPAPSASSSPTVDAAATAALTHAESVVRSTKSFRFTATELLSGDASHATSVRGSVVRGQGVGYTLTANGRTSQVVRIAGATYVRPVPGRWSKLRKPRPVTDPANTLLAVLRGLTAVSLRTEGAAQVVTGSLPPAATKAAQLPVASTPAQVVVTLGPTGHVAKLVVTTMSGSTNVTLTTSYRDFGRILPLKPPV
jgi:hypothetical protein